MFYIWSSNKDKNLKPIKKMKNLINYCRDWIAEDPEIVIIAPLVIAFSILMLWVVCPILINGHL